MNTNLILNIILIQQLLFSLSVILKNFWYQILFYFFIFFIIRALFTIFNVFCEFIFLIILFILMFRGYNRLFRFRNDLIMQILYQIWLFRNLISNLSLFCWLHIIKIYCFTRVDIRIKSRRYHSLLLFKLFVGTYFFLFWALSCLEGRLRLIA